MKKEVLHKELFELAKEARGCSYSPYSGVSVGAALVTEDGKIYTGANIENAAFSPSICAERVALFKAVSEGKRKFSAIAVCGGRADEKEKIPFPPCGVCRQALAEFCNSEFKIVLSESVDEIKTLGELLPLGFRKDSL